MGGRTAGTIEIIFPVEEDTAIVAGERMRLSSGRVSTVLVDTRTVRGPDVGTGVETVILVASGSLIDLGRDRRKEMVLEIRRDFDSEDREH